MVQDDIARSVVKELKTTLLGESPDSAASRVVRQELHEAVKGRAQNPEAYRLYLMARFLADRWTQGDAEKGVEYCRQALKIDPKYAAAWAEMSRIYWILAGNGWTTPALGFERAREAAERALELEPDFAEAHVALGRVQMSYDWDWSAADAAYQRALLIAPGNEAVLRAAGMLAGNLGRLEQAISLCSQAVSLDPLSATAHNSLGTNYYRAGRLEDAVAAMTKSLELNPKATGACFGLATVYMSQGRLAEAETQVNADTSEVFRLLGMVLLAHAREQSKKSDATLQKLIEKYRQDWTYQIAQAFAYRRELDHAFEWLDRAYNQRDPGLSEMKPDPLMINLHGDPRWRAVLEKMGLPAGD